MRGRIYNYDPSTGMGWVTADDGTSYLFDRVASARLTTIQPGVVVDFTPRGENVADMTAVPGSTYPTYAAAAAPGIDWGKLLFTAEGRIRRSHFWAAWGVLFGAGFVLGLIPIINVIAPFALIWPNICVQTKRLHDMGKTGWFQLIPIVVGLGALVVGVAVAMPQIQANGMGSQPADSTWALIGGLFLLYLVVAIGFLIWIGATDGERGPNRFGPSPKGDVAETFA